MIEFITSGQNTGISLRVPQESFAMAVGLVARAVAKHSIQPVLGNIFISTDEDSQRAILAASDMDLAICCSIPASVEQPGDITVPAQKLQDIVAKLPPAELFVKADQNNSIKLSCQRSKFEIRGLGTELFPKELVDRSVLPDALIDIPLSTLLEGLSLVGFASDRREVNSILNGLCFEVSENGLEIAATDGSRLAYYHVPNFKSSNVSKVIIPSRTVTELTKVIASVPDASLAYSLAEGHQRINFTTETRMVSSNLISGTYPKYQQLIPEQFTQRVLLKRKPFLDSLERVAVLANERTKVVKLYFQDSGLVEISANTPDLGEAKDQLDLLEYEGEDFTIAFNVTYMIECLRVLDCEDLELKMSDPLKPIIVSPVCELELSARYLYLLMPVQIRST